MSVLLNFYLNFPASSFNGDLPTVHVVIFPGEPRRLVSMQGMRGLDQKALLFDPCQPREEINELKRVIKKIAWPLPYPILSIYLSAFMDLLCNPFNLPCKCLMSLRKEQKVYRVHDENTRKAADWGAFLIYLFSLNHSIQKTVQL